MLKKYNYNLETGTVGTNDDNIANILYNINRMEMKVSFTTSNVEAFQKANGELFFMVIDSIVHLYDFLEVFNNKVDTDTVNAILTTLEEARKITKSATVQSLAQQVDMSKLCEVFPAVYKKLLALVPTVILLDEQAIGIAQISTPYSS